MNNIYIYGINVISINNNTSGINMVVIIHCLCDLHWFLHVCMRFACVYESYMNNNNENHDNVYT